WLKVQGHSVVRFNLSQDPAEYAAQEQVKQMLADEGVECLPLVFVDDRVVSRSEYPSRENLALWTETPLSPPANTSIGPPANTSTGPPAGTVAGPRHGLPVADCGGGGETGCC
ncbi:MAG: arsenic metallochaperone ArsD family protein, partial [Novipirellula sp. JB048]